jgi:hypothetical protein
MADKFNHKRAERAFEKMLWPRGSKGFWCFGVGGSENEAKTQKNRCSPPYRVAAGFLRML